MLEYKSWKIGRILGTPVACFHVCITPKFEHKNLLPWFLFSINWLQQPLICFMAEVCSLILSCACGGSG